MSTSTVADRSAAPSVHVTDRVKQKDQIAEFVLETTLTPEQRKRIKVLLINASDCILFDPGIPQGLAILGAICESNGIEVQCIDYTMKETDYDEIRRVVEENHINLVGMHCVTVAALNAYRMAKVVKEASRNCVVIIGGSHVTAVKEEPLDNNCDIVFVGEAESAFTEFLNVLPDISKEMNPHPSDGPANATLKNISKLENIRGIAYRDENGGCAFTGNRPRIKNLDVVPYPSRHLFPFPKHYRTPFRIEPVNSMQLVSSRGCTEHCIFCFRGGFKDTITFRSPKNVLGEIKLNLDKFNVRQVDFIDEYLTYDLDHLGEIAQRIKDDKLGIHWAANNTRVDSKADYEFFRFLKSTGCFRVTFGVESGSDTVLHKIGKGITTEEVRRSVAMANKAGLFVAAFFIIGHHADTAEDMEKTIAFAKSLPLDACQFSINTPFPGTPLYTLLERKNQLLLSKSTADYPKTSRNWEEYKGFEFVNFSTETVTPELIMKYYKKAYKEVNFSVQHLWKHVKKFIATRGKYWFLYYTGTSQMVLRFLHGRVTLLGKKL